MAILLQSTSGITYYFLCFALLIYFLPIYFVTYNNWYNKSENEKKELIDLSEQLNVEPDDHKPHYLLKGSLNEKMQQINENILLLMHRQEQSQKIAIAVRHYLFACSYLQLTTNYLVQF